MSEAHRSLVSGIEAVLFDLDGILVDTEPWWHEVRVAWATARGRSWSVEDSHLCMGRNSREWSEIMRERLGVADAPLAIERAIVTALVERYASEPVPLVAGAPATAAAIAARVPVAIASSAHPAVIRAAVAAAGLASLFSTIVSSDDVARGKPSPDVPSAERSLRSYGTSARAGQLGKHQSATTSGSNSDVAMACVCRRK